jgi:hypothetical protein
VAKTKRRVVIIFFSLPCFFFFSFYEYLRFTWKGIARRRRGNRQEGTRDYFHHHQSFPNQWIFVDNDYRRLLQPVRSAYQPPANSTFLSEQTSH